MLRFFPLFHFFSPALSFGNVNIYILHLMVQKISLVQFILVMEIETREELKQISSVSGATHGEILGSNIQAWHQLNHTSHQ